jgi:hypothetical protein
MTTTHDIHVVILNRFTLPKGETNESFREFVNLHCKDKHWLRNLTDVFGQDYVAKNLTSIVKEARIGLYEASWSIYTSP